MLSSSTSFGNLFPRTRSSTCAVWQNLQFSASLITSLYTMMDALMISPVDGSTHDGPIALEIIAGTYLMQEYLRLSGSNSGSSSGVGKSLT